MASSLILNSGISSDRSRESSRRKKKKKTQMNLDRNRDQSNIKWKSEGQQQIYTSKLVQALSKVRLSPSSVSSQSEGPRLGQAVREAADGVLAVAAKGETLWSRSILTNRLKLKLSKRRRRRVSYPANNRSKKPRVSVLRLKGKSPPAVERRVRLLGRLVPGCRKQPCPVILEEATDYIAALEMQVRAMTALTQLLSASGSGSGPGSSSSPPN